MRFAYFLSVLFILITIFSPKGIRAQAITQPAKTDTVREFEIIRGPSLRMIKTDTGTLQTIAGGAIINQGGTIFQADSIILNNDTKNMQAFGNIHINDGDTVHIYSQYLQYSGMTKIANLQKEVKLLGKNGTLFTNQMDYNFETSIGNYYNGGRVTSGKDVITSTEGTYYADTKDVYFKKNVKSDGPENHIRSDSMVYNMDNASVNFISNTYIKNKEIEINTSQGSYDTKTGNAFFSTRSVVKDSSGRLYTANTMALDGKTGNAQLEGNGVIIDSANGFLLLGNQIFLNRQNNSFLATRKPLLIIKQKQDSTYIAADTIFSGLSKMLNQKVIYFTDTAAQSNSLQTEKMDSTQSEAVTESPLPSDSTNSGQKKITADSTELPDSSGKKSTIPAGENPADSLKKDSAVNSHFIDSAGRQLAHNENENSLFPNNNDSTSTSPAKKDTINNENITVQNATEDSLQRAADTSRYFMAYHHVRIYNDSLQSICDSMFISSRDSVFRLYEAPVVWSNEAQVSGDTMLLFTKNKEAQRLYVFDKALVVNKTKEGFFNEMSGKTLNGYFKDNKFDFIRMKGSQAESIYYLQDNDSSYISMNRASGDAIDMHFKNGELEKITMINQVKGTMFPMNQITEDKRHLKDFEWLDNKRPKNKAELFE